MRRRTLALATLVVIGCGGDAPAGPPPGAVRITVTWPGASPEAVERELLTPLEDATAGLPGVVRVDGRAVENVAVVELAARSPAAVERLAAAARDAITAALPRLPADAAPPMITRAWRTPTVLAIVPLPSTDDPRRAGARGRELQRRTEVLSGVTAVDVCGLVDDQLLVRLDPPRLAAYGLTATDLLAALRANTALPAGRIDTTGVATTIRTTGAGLADLEGLPLRDGVRLRDVATIERAAVAPCVGHTPAGPALIVAIEVASPAAARAVATALRGDGADVLPAQAVVGHVALPDVAADGDAIAGELLRAGATAVRVRREPPALEVLVAAGVDERALAAIDGAVARRGFGAVRWAGRGVVALEALLPAADLDVALTTGERAVAALSAVGYPPRVDPRRAASREITIDRARAADLGVPVVAIADALRVALGDATLSHVVDGPDELAVRVAWPPGDAPRLDLTVASPRLGAVPLRDLVTVTEHSGPSAIVHRDRRRVVAVWVRVPAGRRGALGRAIHDALPTATVSDAW
ncbi:MAG: efflux RND transporter permease subunit [Myxococcales bacterium]|nr:efflux RND transporter permease subunit [Myxococcales bacterium]